MSDLNAQSIIDTVERLATIDLIGSADSDMPHGLALAVLPKDKRVEDLKPYLDKLRVAPERIEATAKTTTIQSFIDYANRFKMADSALFLDDNPTKPGLLGVIDFHGGSRGVVKATGEEGNLVDAVIVEASDSTPGSTVTPRFGRHQVRYDFPLSEQVKAWTGIYGKGLTHVEMAEFLNERQYDIANPPLDWMQVDKPTVELILYLLNIQGDQGEVDDDGPDAEPTEEDDDRYIPRSAIYKLRQIRFGSTQRLLQMARTVEISAEAKSVEGYQPKTGERTIQFEETHEARSQGRKIIVPDAFLLKIPVFEGETPQLLPVRLQYRRAGGIKWFMTLVEWQRAVRFAVRTEAQRVNIETELPLFYGQPKSGT